MASAISFLARNDGRIYRMPLFMQRSVRVIMQTTHTLETDIITCWQNNRHILYPRKEYSSQIPLLPGHLGSNGTGESV